MQGPLFTQALSNFIAPARAKSQLWRLIVGTIVVVAIYFAFTIAVFGVWIALDGSEPAAGIVSMSALGNTRESLAVILFSFFGLFIGLWVAVRLLHKRSFGSLIGPSQPTIRNFFIAVGVFLVLQAAVYLIWAVVFDAVPNRSLYSVLAFLPIAAVLVLIQTGAEELVFRGYLLQQLSARFQSPIIWFALPPVGFALLHYNPDMMGNLTWVAIAAIGLTGLLWTDLTRKSGNIGAAWGWHFINNFMLMNFLGNQGELNGFVWKTTPYGIADMPPALFMVDVVVALLTWAILRRLCKADCISTEADIFR